MRRRTFIAGAAATAGSLAAQPGALARSERTADLITGIAPAGANGPEAESHRFDTGDMIWSRKEFDMHSVALMELKSRVRGQVLLPGAEGYDAERAGWNQIVEHHPELIVVASGPEDVSAAVRYAASEDLPVAVQATGHGPSVPADGAVLISTRLMTGLTVDPAAGTARIGAGVRGKSLLEAAASHGLAPLVGSTPDVGMVGYLTSGGLPMLGRRYGFAADHVRSLELVTADGKISRVTADEHPDLFFAARGGKANFGVVTAVEMGLVPVTRLYGGGLSFPGAATWDVLSAWLEWTAAQPEDVASSSVALRRFPDLPEVPEPVRGKFLVHVRVAYTGRAEEGERLIQPLRALKPVMDTVSDIPYTRIGEVHNDPAGPAPVRDRGVLLGELDNGAVERITVLAGAGAELPAGQLELRHLGGALSRVPAVPSALSHRDAPFGLNLGMIAPPGDEGRVDRAQQTLLDGLGPWDTGATLPNFLGSGATDPQRVRPAYSDADYERLAAIKKTYDPRNLFRINHNILPAA
jgi:FAD/FMN-containing dehydrogenase